MKLADITYDSFIMATADLSLPLHTRRYGIEYALTVRRIGRGVSDWQVTAVRIDNGMTFSGDLTKVKRWVTKDSQIGA